MLLWFVHQNGSKNEASFRFKQSYSNLASPSVVIDVDSEDSSEDECHDDDDDDNIWPVDVPRFPYTANDGVQVLVSYKKDCLEVYENSMNNNWYHC
jgi:hypothetical protein